MSKRIFTAYTLIPMLIGCGLATTKATSDADTTIVESAQKTENIEDEILKLTDMKITEKEWQEIKDSYNKLSETDTDMYSDVLNIADVSIGGSLECYGLQQRGFKSLSDSLYVERIRGVFGIDLNNRSYQRNNKIRTYRDYIVYLKPYSRTENHTQEGCCEFVYERRHNYYFFRKHGVVFYSQPLVEIIDMQHSIDKDNIYIHSNQYNSIPVFHWNNYIIHGNKGSLVWLKNNGFIANLQNLLYYFGYDKEESINRLVLDEIVNMKNESYQRIFAGWDIEDKLHVREGLLQTVSVSTTSDFDKYYLLLERYTQTLCSDDNQDRELFRTEFSVLERRKVLAYTVNTLQPLYSKYYSGNEEVISPIVVDVVENDPDIIAEWKQNNYYGLQDLQKIVEKLPKRD